MRKLILFVCLISLIGSSKLVLGTVIANEEFNYTAGTALDGQSGGTGWNGAWSATAGSPMIANGNLNNDAVINPVNTNSASFSDTTGDTATRSFSSTATASITSALTTTNGLWGRYIQNVPNSPTVDAEATFFLALASPLSFQSVVGINKSSQFNSYELQLATAHSSGELSPTTPGTNDLVIFNVQHTGTSTFSVDLWVLDQTDTSFDPSSSPLISFSGTLSGYNTNGASVFFDASIVSPPPQLSSLFDELYIGETVNDLNLNVVPEPTTICSLLAGMGLFVGKYKKSKKYSASKKSK